MKKVLKVIVAISAVLALLLICFYTYYFISKTKAQKVPLSPNTNWVIKLDGVAAAKILIKDLLFPLDSKPSADTSHFRNVKGISIPLFVYIYNTHQCPTTFFTSVLLNDEHVLVANLKHQETWVRIDSVHKNVFKHKTQNLWIAYNRKNVFWAWNIQNNAGIDELKALITNSNTKAFKKTPYAEALDNNWVVSGTNLKDNFHVAFQEDKILLSGALEWMPNNSAPLHLKNTDSAQLLTACIHTQTPLAYKNWIQLSPEVKSFADALLPADTALNMVLQIDTTNIPYQDTSIVHEYDDNFNRINKQLVTQKMLPLISFGINRPIELQNYLYNHSRQVNSAYFPIFPLYVHTMANATLLSNTKDAQQLPKLVTDNNCGFQLKAQLPALLQHTDWIKTWQAATLFTHLNITGSYIADQKLAFEGTIQLLPQQQNALKTLYHYYRYGAEQ